MSSQTNEVIPPIYRHHTCDAMLQTKLTPVACIGCGGDMVFFDMDVPQERRDISKPANRRWLLRNLGIRNKDHELFGFAIQKIKERER